MNCLRCGKQLIVAVCNTCGFDHKTTPIMLLTRAEENSLHISRFFNIDIVSDESLSIDKRYEYGVDAFQTGDYKAALHWLQSPAKKGNHNAQFLLGQIYEMPGAFNDQSQALYWYEQAAARGNKNALAILIHHYETARLFGGMCTTTRIHWYIGFNVKLLVLQFLDCKQNFLSGTTNIPSKRSFETSGGNANSKQIRIRTYLLIQVIIGGTNDSLYAFTRFAFSKDITGRKNY